MEATRREILKGTIAISAAIALPIGAPIPELAPIATLASLAAEGKYASVEYSLPDDIMNEELDWVFTLDGRRFMGFVKEIYAPGDHSGWAVVYPEREPGQKFTGKTELVRGSWSMKRVLAEA